MKKIIIFILQLSIMTTFSQSLTNWPGSSIPGNGNGAFLINATNNRLNLLESGTFGSNGSDMYLSIGRNNINTNGSVGPNFANLYGFTSTANSDRLFVGVLSDNNNTNNHSLINWGDDDGDLLLFRHTNPGGNSTNNASFWANSRIRFGPHTVANSFTTAPTTTLEIESPIVPLANLRFLSGLRFRGLLNNTASTNLWTNPTNRFLTVDDEGYVVLSQGADLNNWLLTGNSGITAPTVPIGTQIPTSGTGSGNYLGTQNNAPLVLATNQLERMRISGVGN